MTEYRFVIVSYNGRAAFGESLGEALAKLFPGFEGDLGDRVGADDGLDATDRRTPNEPQTDAARRPSCCRRPTSCSTRPTAAGRRTATSATYQDKVDEAKALVEQALDGCCVADRRRLAPADRRRPTGG